MKIVPLNKKYLDQAINLTLKVFTDAKPDDFDYPEKWLRYSVANKKDSDYVSSLG